MWRRGSSLIEALIGLTLTMGILAASLGFLDFGRRVFFKLKTAEEERLAVLAALEKIRIDVGRAGMGLLDPVRWGLVHGLVLADEDVTVESLERRLVASEDMAAGSTRVSCTGTDDLAAGRIVCIFDDDKGEIASIGGSGRGFISLSAPLRYSYDREECQIAVVGSVRFFLRSGILRRQANGGSAQPLLDDVEEWEVVAGSRPSVIGLSIRLKGKERTYAISVLCKNIALASAGV